MKKKIFLSLSSFFAVLVLHASYSIVQTKRLAERWVEMNEINYLKLYFERTEYLIGASYALAIGFSVYALLRFLKSRKAGFTGLARQTSVGLVGGITLTGVLYVAGCFLLGCCGSPMLAVYLTLFGSSFLGFTKPLIFGLTLASIVVGYIWIERKSVPETDCSEGIHCDCEGEKECKPE